ncbi:MAG: hypothetical protein IJW49_10170 [Clostridia bacterium]|nr:hypothetical protein [Clostridia bacterium]
MTLYKQIPQKTATHTLSLGQLLFGWFSLFCLLLIFKNGEIASDYIHRGLLLCAKSVIPSLFPFMVLSELLISGGMGERIIGKIASPLSRLFRLPPSAISAVLLGLVCGFPIGAKTVAGAYRQGRLSRQDAERALCISNNPSSAFVVAAVGTSLWENTRFGVVLYLTVISVSLLWGLADGVLQRKRTEPQMGAVQVRNDTEYLKGAKLFTESIRSATGGILSVCAYVVFFSALMGALSAIFLDLGAPKLLSSISFSILELSQGVSHAPDVGNTVQAAILSAFACGWSGLSVHCQVISVCDGLDLSFRRYFLAKLVQALLCAAVFAVLLQFFPSILIPSGSC